MKLKYALLAVFGLAATSQAATVVTTANQSTPYTVSATDLINGLTPTSQAGIFTNEGALGVPALTNGTYVDTTVGSFATGEGGFGNGEFVTYQFATTDISSVVVYGGWADLGRDALNFSLQFSTDNGATFGSAILSGLFNPTIPAATPSATRITVSDNAGNLANGVNAMRVNFLTTENGFSGYSEIDVNAVPEPSSLFLLGLGSLAAMGIRRRK